MHVPFLRWFFFLIENIFSTSFNALFGPPSSYKAESDVRETKAARLSCRFQVEELYIPFIKFSEREHRKNTEYF